MRVCASTSQSFVRCVSVCGDTRSGYRIALPRFMRQSPSPGHEVQVYGTYTVVSLFPGGIIDDAPKKAQRPYTVWGKKNLLERGLKLFPTHVEPSIITSSFTRGSRSTAGTTVEQKYCYLRRRIS